jgi:hypothetical protein
MSIQQLTSARTSVFWAFILSFLLTACTKKSNDALLSEEVLSSQFFSFSTINDNDIKSLAQEIKQKNNSEHFLSQFIRNSGYILWNDAEKIGSSKGVLAILPFAFSNAKQVNGFIIARKDYQLNTTTFDVFSESNLEQYGFTENSPKLDAQKVQSITNHFNFKKFTTTSYTIQNIQLLPEVRQVVKMKTEKQIILL